MSNVLVAVTDETPVDPLKNTLRESGYGVQVTRGCVDTTRSAVEDLQRTLKAVILESTVVRDSVRAAGRTTDIVSELRSKLSRDIPIMVFMTMPFDDVAKDVQEAIWKSDAIVDVPNDPPDIVSRLSGLLALAPKA